MCNSGSLLIFATGTIESAIFPLGPENSQLYCRFEIVTGSNWELISGINKGISQVAMFKQSHDKVVFNMPFECVYRTDDPFGWPQIIVSIYGKNRWSVETTAGYAWSHFPTIGKHFMKTTQPIRIPRETTIMGELSNWITSRNSEIKNPNILLDSYNNTELLSLEHNGELELSLRTIFRGTNGKSKSCGKMKPEVLF